MPIPERINANSLDDYLEVMSKAVYYFLFRVRESVPDFDTWIETIPGNHPRMREMVEHAEEQDRRSQAG